jgi:hypothetical protein
MKNSLHSNKFIYLIACASSILKGTIVQIWSLNMSLNSLIVFNLEKYYQNRLQ